MIDLYNVVESILDDEEQIIDNMTITVGEKLGILNVSGQLVEILDKVLKASFIKDLNARKLRGKYKLRHNSGNNSHYSHYADFSLLILDTPYIGWQQSVLMFFKHYLKSGWDVKIDDQWTSESTKVRYIAYVFSKKGVEEYYVSYSLSPSKIGTY